MSNTWHLPDSHGRFMSMVTPSAPPENGRGGRPQKIKRVGMMLCRRRVATLLPKIDRSTGMVVPVTCLPLLPEESGSGGHHSLASLVVVMVVVIDEVGIHEQLLSNHLAPPGENGGYAPPRWPGAARWVAEGGASSRAATGCIGGRR